MALLSQFYFTDTRLTSVNLKAFLEENDNETKKKGVKQQNLFYCKIEILMKAIFCIPQKQIQCKKDEG